MDWGLLLGLKVRPVFTDLYFGFPSFSGSLFRVVSS